VKSLLGNLGPRVNQLGPVNQRPESLKRFLLLINGIGLYAPSVFMRSPCRSALVRSSGTGNGGG